MHIDVFAEYLRSIKFTTPSNAIRALPKLGGANVIRVNGKCTDAYGP